MDTFFFYARFSGLLGCLVLAAAVLHAAFGYTGRKGERYSPLNHFISELGEIGVSRRARVFNVGMILAGLLLLPFLAGLGLMLRNTWALLGLAVGVWACLSCAAVGLFPMDDLAAHIKAALSYFYAGFATAALFTVAILTKRGHAISGAAVAAGILAITSHGIFLVLGAVLTWRSGGDPRRQFDPSVLTERPAVWGITVAEWAVLLTTLGWFATLLLDT